MSVVQQVPEPGVGSSPDERWALVQRIVSSQHFVKAPQIRDILLYLTKRSLEDDTTSISEVEVGCNVLGRRPDFNPNEDNIVRVQVRHLRKKLEDYFKNEGQHEPVILTIPKGAYLSKFSPRQAGESDATGSSEISTPPRPAEAGGPAAPARSLARPKNTVLLWGLAGMGVLVIALAMTSLRLWQEKERVTALVPAPSENRIPAADDVLWSKIFAPGQSTTVVVADTCLVMLQDILDVDIPLKDIYANSRLTKLVDGIQDPKLRAAMSLIERRQYTSLGDLHVTTRLLDLGREYHARPRVRYARYLDTREFQSGNFILIGSRRGLPWIQLFEPQLNFHLERDARTSGYRFVNRSPQPGEQPFYGNLPAGQVGDESFADIAILPNLTETGYVVIISGITMEATEAAGAMVVGKDFSATLARLVKGRPGPGTLPYAEILLQTKTMPGTAKVSKILCHRLLNAQKAEP